MRHAGAGAPAHRWTVTVLALVALASLPTVAAISAGSATLGDTVPPDGTTPFIAQPAGPPYVVVPSPPIPLRPEQAATAPQAATVPSPPRRRGDAAGQGLRRERHHHRSRPPRRPVAPLPGPAADRADDSQLGSCPRPVLGWRALPGREPTVHCAAAR